MLHKIIANEIINLEYDVDCPSFDKLSSNVYCVTGADINRESYAHCVAIFE